MQEQINFQEDAKSKLNPENCIQSRKKSKLKSPNKKFKVKKLKKSLTKQNCWVYQENPIYDGLKTQQNIKGNQINIGPWIRQKTKPKQNDHINKSYKNNGKQCQKKQQIPIKTQQIHIKNKSQCVQQLLQCQQTQINSNKPAKNIKKNKFFIQIPVRSAILQQQEIQVSKQLPQIFYKKDLFKLRQSSLDFGIHKKQKQRSIIHIEQSQQLSHHSKGSQSNKVQIKLKETKSEKFIQKYYSGLFFEKKINPNIIIHTYRANYTNRSASTSINFRSAQLQRIKNKQFKINQNVKEQILKKKLNGVNIKIRSSNHKMKKIKGPIQYQKQSPQHQLIKDFVQLRLRVKQII